MFMASRGWFDIFKRHSNSDNIRITDETAIMNKQAAAEFPSQFKALMEVYTPQLVFNVDETRLFWKKMLSRTFLFKEEQHISGFKEAKDHLTLFLGGNAT